MTESVADFCSRHSLVGASGVIAVSGGPDSVCLAKILRALKGQSLFPKLVLAHLNHQLRGAESDADEAFVVALGQQWDVPVRTQQLDVAAAAHASSANLEETARHLRYHWLAQVARDEECGWVATGHSADDQAETVLHRLLRGSGFQGLAGMAPTRPLETGIALVRPLLTTRRSAILAYLADQRQDYRVDPSNQDLRFTRNRLRHELLPLLGEQFNPAIVEIVCRLAEQAGEVHKEIAHNAARLLEEAELPRAGDMIVLKLAALARGTRHLQREVFRLVWQREHWPMGQMTFEAWDRLAQLVEGAVAALDLPAGIRARRAGRVVQLERVPAL